VKSIHAVGGVVYRVGQKDAIELLLIRKKGGLWTLPKGKLKAGEAHDCALLRELHEETGVVGLVEDLIGEASYIVQKQTPRPKVVTYYLVRATGGTLRPDPRERIERVAWMPVPRALNRIRRARLRTLIRAALTMLGPVAAHRR
jgi:8-oxo-dGTP diphosphatase